jgi:hypothetical protein
MAQQTSAQNAQAQAQAQNTAAENLINLVSVERVQNISTQTVNPANQNVLNIQPRYVGLIKGFWVVVQASVTAAAGSAATRTALGPANALSQIRFDDLQNNTRIQTTGWHMHLLNTARINKPYGISYAFQNAPVAYGDNLSGIEAPASIAASGTGTVTMRYYVPLAYGHKDLRGAVYAGVTNATMNLQLTINPAFFTAAADAVGSVFSGNAGVVNSVTVNVYQHYLDQLPQGPQGVILPAIDMQTFYDIKNTFYNTISANQDNPFPYSNYRSFMSTFAIYDNGGTLNPGSDINYFSLQSANFTNIFKMDPAELALQTRCMIGTDYPSGVYYISTRNKPINTNQFGNIELVMNPSAVSAGAQVLLGYEAFGQIGVMNQAGSLPGGG